MTEPASIARYDMYRLIHKGLRACMVDTLTAVGSMDADDDQEVADVLARVRGLLAFCRKHVAHEESFVHAAMEAREPGSAAEAADDHQEHIHEIETLEQEVAAVEAVRGAARAAAAHSLYRRLAVFVGENLVHMEIEESHNNKVLWRTHSDAELMAIQRAIVASQSPDEQMVTMRWMIAAATPAERAGLLAAVRGAVPPEAFNGILELARSCLRPGDHDKLMRSLAASTLAA